MVHESTLKQIQPANQPANAAGGQARIRNTHISVSHLSGDLLSGDPAADVNNGHIANSCRRLTLSEIRAKIDKARHI